MKKIKIASLLAVIPGLLLAVLIACNKDEESADRREPAVAKSGTTIVTMACKGSCSNSSASCSLQGALSENNSIVSCTCSGCSMEITTVRNGIVTISSESFYNVLYLEQFFSFMRADYSGSDYELTLVEVMTGNGHQAEIYYFKLEDGTAGSVMYVDEMNGLQKEVKQIDCKGTCDCREQYNMILAWPRAPAPVAQ